MCCGHVCFKSINAASTNYCLKQVIARDALFFDAIIATFSRASTGLNVCT